MTTLALAACAQNSRQEECETTGRTTRDQLQRIPNKSESDELAPVVLPKAHELSKPRVLRASLARHCGVESARAEAASIPNEVMVVAVGGTDNATASGCAKKIACPKCESSTSGIGSFSTRKMQCTRKGFSRLRFKRPPFASGVSPTCKIASRAYLANAQGLASAREPAPSLLMLYHFSETRRGRPAVRNPSPSSKPTSTSEAQPKAQCLRPCPRSSSWKRRRCSRPTAA